MKTPSAILAVASLTASVHAHGYISKPKATYQPNTVYTTYNALTTAAVNSAFAGGKYDGSPSQNAQVFADHWNATGYKSLREMVDPIATDYGFSVKTATPVDVTGYTEMWWQNDEYKEGFIASHEGPCEGWIDDTRIFHYDNCAAQFKTYPAKIPADYSSCKGDCLFSFYWLALHEPNWQIYKQCVPITNNGSGATTTTDAPVVTPAATTTKSGTTEAPVATPTTSTPEVTSTPVATKGPTVPTTTPAPEATPAETETPATEVPEEPATVTPEEQATDAPEEQATDAPEEPTTEIPEETNAPTTSTPSKPDNCKM
ncbi:hypothetical protein DVH05_022518 [Phytophthora capsici]|nr:hypothetical protein DVH05_022518 [Phytophthora capsici]|eukprot:jgi/Phyca11/103479/e_gw1.8.270.1